MYKYVLIADGGIAALLVVNALLQWRVIHYQRKIAALWAPGGAQGRKPGASSNETK
jgi:hypothetical protein